MIRSAAFALALVAMLPGSALSQDYPTQTVKIIVPYPAGGTADIFARYIAEEMRAAWSQKEVIVEARPGAGGNVASNMVAHAEPDGYTLLLGTSGSNAVNPGLYTDLPYDAATQMTVIAPVASTANVLVVGGKSKAEKVEDLIAMARAKPDTVTYGSSGIGSVLHLSGAMLAHKSDVKMTHIPYQGTPPALVDVVAGRVDMMIANAPSVVGQVESGALKALAVTPAERSVAFPDVPTMIEAGVPDYDLSSWFAIMGPTGIPRPTLEKINATVNDILAKDKTKERFSAMGSSPLSMGVDEADAFFQAELEKWAELVKISGAKVE